MVRCTIRTHLSIATNRAIIVKYTYILDIYIIHTTTNNIILTLKRYLVQDISSLFNSFQIPHVYLRTTEKSNEDLDKGNCQSPLIYTIGIGSLLGNTKIYG